MNRLKKSELGFSTIEAVLLVVIVILIAGVGWYVYRAKQNSTTIYNTAASVSTLTKPAIKKPKSTPPAIDPTANWQTVKSSDATYSIKTPQNWVSLTCEKFGGSGTSLYIASSQTYLAKCSSDFLGEAYLYVAADQSATVKPTKGATDQSFSTQPITVNSISGYKTTNLTSASDAITPNTTYTTYSFYTKNMSFYARYQQITNAPNDLNTFDQIVQTWKF